MMRKDQPILVRAYAVSEGQPPSPARGRLFARLRAWLAGAVHIAGERAAPEVQTAGSMIDLTRRAAVVPFPLSGRGVLLQLARDLDRTAGMAAADGEDPVLLTVESGPNQRLIIDSTAYVDVRKDPLPYRVVLGDDLATRITLETADVAEARSFISQYLMLTRGRTMIAGDVA